MSRERRKIKYQLTLCHHCYKKNLLIWAFIIRHFFKALSEQINQYSLAKNFNIKTCIFLDGDFRGVMQKSLKTTPAWVFSHPQVRGLNLNKTIVHILIWWCKRRLLASPYRSSSHMLLYLLSSGTFIILFAGKQ